MVRIRSKDYLIVITPFFLVYGLKRTLTPSKPKERVPPMASGQAPRLQVDSDAHSERRFNWRIRSRALSTMISPIYRVCQASSRKDRFVLVVFEKLSNCDQIAKRDQGRIIESESRMSSEV
jgi:hypothetical protein